MFVVDTANGSLYQRLYVVMKIFSKDNDGRRIVRFANKLIIKNEGISEKNVLEYTFYNFGNCIVFINGFPIFPAVVNGDTLPASIAHIHGGMGKIINKTNNNEFDETNYNVVFKNITNFFTNKIDFSSTEVQP